MAVCQSTFRMWFIIADITIHLMATWSFHNDSAGSALTMLKDRSEQAHSFQYTVTEKPDQTLTQRSWVHPGQRLQRT